MLFIYLGYMLIIFIVIDLFLSIATNNVSL